MNKILHFYPYVDLPGGVVASVLGLAKYQSRIEGVDVSIITGKVNNNELVLDNVKIHRFGIKRFFFFSIPCYKKISNIKPDLVFIYSSFITHNFSIALYLNFKKIPYVVLPQGGLNPGNFIKKKIIKKFYYYFIEKNILKKSKYIVIQNDTEEIYSGVKKYSKKFFTLLNGFDESMLPKELNCHYLNERFKLNESHIKFVFLSRFDIFTKGIDILFPAIKKVLNVYSNVKLFMVGPNWNGQIEIMNNLLKQLDIDKNVIFTGPLYGEDKYHLLSSADLFILPSRRESISQASLEALAVGCPVAVTKQTNILEKVLEYDCGIEIFHDIDLMSNMLMYFIEEKLIEIQSMRSRSSMLQKDFYNWSKIAEQSLRLLCKSY